MEMRNERQTMPEIMPALAICGFSGAGKTTLIEAVLPLLKSRGLRVAVIKHDAHGMQIDQPGKDSDRLYQAGADIIVHGPGEYLLRGHGPDRLELEQVLAWCRHYYDLILVEGHKDTSLAKVWLDSDGQAGEIPAGVVNVIARLSRDQERAADLLQLLDHWLPERLKRVPVYACILIGGRSLRMGRPKHLLGADTGISWIEQQMTVLEPLVQRVVVAGTGRLPPKLAELERLSDVPDVQGPLAGMLAALRWQPHACWLIVACDMPSISPEAIEWLLAQRLPGRHAIQPRLRTDAPVEPLLACYETQAIPTLETMVRQSERSPSRLSAHAPVHSPVIPESLAGCWRNVNCHDDLID